MKSEESKLPAVRSIAWLDGTRRSTLNMAKLLLCLCDKRGTRGE
jgi:hypothetical protein